VRVDEVIPAIEQRNTRIAVTASLLTCVGVIVVAYVWHWALAVAIVWVTLRTVPSFLYGDDALERLRGIVRWCRPVIVESRSRGVLWAIMTAILESLFVIPQMTLIAVALCWIPAIGWMLALSCFLAALLYPAYSLFGHLKDCQVKCPLCDRWLDAKRGAERRCGACRTRFICTPVGAVLAMPSGLDRSYHI
jgi:uncharacterized membrane protein